MKIQSPTIGAPCWFEFSSTDAPRSLAFFCSLFEWEHHDQDMGPMGTYSFLQHANGGMVGAHWQMPEAQRAMNIPSNWGVYFKVTSVDASHQQALAEGATEYVAPMNVSDYGRMSVLSDPSGAVFSLWEERAPNSDPLVMFETHAIGWVELATRAAPQAQAFYKNLLHWEYSASAMADKNAIGYTRIHIDDIRYGGILPMTNAWDGIPPHWGVYIVVANVDACIQHAELLGGKCCVSAFDIPDVGRIAVINEPTGGSFNIIELMSSS
jgi:uncharacterized protein